MPGRRHRMPNGFASQSQWRMFWANKRLRRWAHEIAHRTMRKRGGVKVAYHSLPPRKGVKRRAR